MCYWITMLPIGSLRTYQGMGSPLLMSIWKYLLRSTKSSPRPSQLSMWGKLRSWRWGSRCSWRGCHQAWGYCHGWVTNHRDTLSYWGVGPRIWVSTPSNIGWRHGSQLPNNLPSGVNNVMHNSWPSTMQGGLIPSNINSTTTWVCVDFMKLQIATHNLDWAIWRKRRSPG